MADDQLDSVVQVGPLKFCPNAMYYVLCSATLFGGHKFKHTCICVYSVALLVAARLHNFNRSVREVAKVVKLSEGTIRKRLGDFKDTASSRLTIDEFLKIDLEQEHDPPSFNEAKKKSKQQQIVS